MKIRKRVLISSLLISIVIIFAIIFFIFSSYLNNSKISCNDFNKLYTPGECGYVSSSIDQEYHRVIGVIAKKSYNKDDGSFVFLTKDSQNRVYSQHINLTPNTLKTSIQILKRNGNSFTTSTELFDSAKALDKLKQGEEIIVHLATPQKSTIEEAKKQLGNMKYLSCLKTNKEFIQFLTKPSIKNLISLKFNQLSSLCNPTTFQITIMSVE